MAPLKGALQRFAAFRLELRPAHVHERISTQSVVVLSKENSKSNHLGAQGTINVNWSEKKRQRVKQHECVLVLWCSILCRGQRATVPVVWVLCGGRPCVDRPGPGLAGFLEPLEGWLSMSELCLATSTVGRMSKTECPQTTSVMAPLVLSALREQLVKWPFVLYQTATPWERLRSLAGLTPTR